MKILITGSNGLIGTALKEALTAANIRYDVVERASNSPRNVEIIPAAGNGPTIYRISWPAGLAAIPYSDYSTVVHLALARPNPNAALAASINEHLVPVRAIIDGIQRNKSDCSLLFLSSQSSSPNAVSAYGQGKWECEQLMRHSTIAWSVVRPGLVVSNTAQGLFGTIVNLIKRSPIVPVPAGSLMRVQPVALADVITACLRIISQPTQHAGGCYDLALPPRSLVTFTQEVCRSLGLKRSILPIPWKLIRGLLRLSEYLPCQLPVSRTNLEGLLASREMNSDQSAAILKMSLHNTFESTFAPPSGNTISGEAQSIFKALFGAEAPAEVVTRYSAAQRSTLLNGAWIDIDAIVRKQLDIEAIEFASRRRKTILSQKMYIMCYVAEQSPQLLPQFINSHTCRLRAFTELGIAGVRSAWKLLYGTYLIKRFNLLERDQHD